MKPKLVVVILAGAITLLVIGFVILSKSTTFCLKGTPVPTADGGRKCLPDLPPGMAY